MRKLSLLVVLLAFPAAAEARPHGEIVTTANTFEVAGVFKPNGTGETFWPGMIVGDVATGDVNGDGTDDFVLGSGRGGGARVRVLDGITRATLMDFSPQKGGAAVRVAAGDVTGDGRADIATAPAWGEGPVRVYNGVGGGLLRTFNPYSHVITEGVDGIAVALGDITGDGRADIVTGPAQGDYTLVKAFDGVTNNVIRSFVAVDQEWGGGVDVATGNVSGDGREDIVVVPSSGPNCLMEFWDEHGLAFHIGLGQRFPCFITKVDVGNIDLDSANEVVFGNGYGPPAKVGMFDDSILMMTPFQPFQDWAYEGNGVAVQTVK